MGNPTVPPLDWTLVQAFVAVAETGSFSAAARRLGLSQPTVGRQVHALETALSAELFLRRPQGVELTPTGAALLPQAEAMRAAAGRIGLIAAGETERIEGTVRVTASRATAVHYLPEIIARLRAEEPGIQVELVASDESQNLLFREADIAVRMYRPTQPELITRHVGEMEIGIYASEGFLQRCPVPDTLVDLKGLELVGYDALPMLIEGFRRFGIEMAREDFATRTDDHAAYIGLVQAGAGIGFLQVRIAERLPGLRRLAFGPLPTLPIWLTAHEALRRTPRVRRVWEALDEGLSALVM